MSSITSAVSGLLSSADLHIHGRRRGAHATSSGSSGSSGSSIGQLPVGASTALFSGLVQSFEQTLGSQPASSGSVTAATAATSTTSPSTAASVAPAPTPAEGQDLHAFQHSLVQALKQDGLSANSPGSAASSLQTLIQQLGPNGKPTAATETLTSTFQNMVNNYDAKTGNTSSGGTSNAGLLTFLNNLVQKVQATGSLPVTTSGSNVNAQV